MHINNIHIKDTEKSDNNAADEITRNVNETCSKCEHCTFVGTNVDMEKHVIKKHVIAVICGECGLVFPDISHVHHTDPAQGAGVVPVRQHLVEACFVDEVVTWRDL